jgi:TRAP-type uncharacterized transport system fused permease subunit
MIVQMVEVMSAGNIFLLLFITAIASLILGMGLPTTATYIVMASITVPIIVKLGGGMGLMIPAVAAHLFCFYFGILADDTPPVGLAAYTAAAIAKTDPVPVGIKGFIYDLRTALIPFMFVLNPELILHGINSIWQAILIFVMATLGSFAFANAMQGRFLTKNRIWEIPIFLAASLLFFAPAEGARFFGIPHEYRYLVYLVAMGIYAIPFFTQKMRMKATIA